MSEHDHDVIKLSLTLCTTFLMWSWVCWAPRLDETELLQSRILAIVSTVVSIYFVVRFCWILAS